MIFPRGLLKPVGSFLSALTFNQRLSLFMLAAMVLVALFVVVFLSASEEYAPVCGAMEPQALAQAAQSLRQARIPFKIEGGALKVRGSQADEAFAIVAYRAGEEAVPFSFEDLVKPEGLSWQTAEERHTRLLVATQNRLASYIHKYPGVAWASVTLDLPRERLSMAGQELGRATVVFKTRGGEELSEREYFNIARLVAGVSRMLTPDRVTVTNLSTGHAVIPTKKDEMFSDAGDRLRAQKELADLLENKIQGLYGLLGPDNVVVRVFPKLDMTQKVTHETTPDPGTAIIEREKETEESRNGPSASQPGVLAQAGQNANYTRTEKIVPKLLAESLKKVDTTEGPGGLEELKVSVIVNGDRIREIAARKIGAGAGRIDETRLAAAEQEILSDLKSLVSLPGLKTEDLQFKAVPFALPAGAAAPEAAPWFRELLTENLATIGLLGLALLAVVIALVQARRSLPAPAAPQPAGLGAFEPAAQAAAEASEAEAERVGRMTEKIQEIVMSNPATSAGLLRRWIGAEK